jgi:cytochrome c peroxidase
MPHGQMVTQVQASAAYRKAFQRAFPGQPIDAGLVAKALAAFERSLVFISSPFDRWVAGDETAISDQAKDGFLEFNTFAGCSACHSGWNFTDFKLRDIGIGGYDLGRFGVDGDEAAQYAFKTPSLRNVAERAPYMHNGAARTLDSMVAFYDTFARRPTLAPEMQFVSIRASDDLIAFLRTLTTPVPEDLVRDQEALERITSKRVGKPAAPPAVVHRPPTTAGG